MGVGDVLVDVGDKIEGVVEDKVEFGEEGYECCWVEVVKLGEFG